MPTETLDTLAIGRRICADIDILAAISEHPGEITRVFLTPQHRGAATLLVGWMEEASMVAHVDAIGNVCGRYEGEAPGLPCVMLGSHYDTVRNAGRWDGPLGVVTAIACVSDLARRGLRLPFAIEVVAFADEEGVRFPATLLGSRAVAGTFDDSVLATRDRDGISMRDAMRSFGLDPDHIGRAARAPSEILAYLELHIEQGPVLEDADLPIGVVSAISGATRLSVELTGMAGHAGTVPMALRRDALAGAAECILAIEEFCRTDVGLVGTVGSIEAAPGATNVIPGHVSFSMDVRAASDIHRRRAVNDLVRRIDAIAARRTLNCNVQITHENKTAPCANWLQAQIATSVARAGFQPLTLPSGAGHDGMAMADLADIGMIFVRCRGGLSHHPDEHVSVEDVGIGAAVLQDVLLNFEKTRLAM